MLSSYEWTALAVLKEELNIITAKYVHPSEQIIATTEWIKKRIEELEKKKEY